ncbi:hypothetical protein [uncultured Thiodictyon sp.]|uniref:hypothetical protein n=1 Tax=uncultured Thiodictyon sp. TaxID=1846217 RepID=UPI0025E92FDD|nr:hypothetical protein [uncultured Thiodictyon sp.]
MVEKEIWVYLPADNLIRLLMAQAALLADQVPRQLSFKLRTLWQHYRDALATAADLAALLAMMAEPRVGLRPGRIEPRALKRRPRNFPLLMEPPGTGPTGDPTRWTPQGEVRRHESASSHHA